jgi:hypothetical protein
MNLFNWVPRSSLIVGHKKITVIFNFILNFTFVKPFQLYKSEVMRCLEFQIRPCLYSFNKQG